MGSSDDWQQRPPVLADKTSTRFLPEDFDEDTVVKYYFRVRSYGLLAVSDHSSAVITYFPGELKSSNSILLLQERADNL